MIDTLLCQFRDTFKNQDFQYGRVDCLLFANEWVKQYTGKDFRLIYPAEYQTEQQAYDYLESCGYHSVTDLLDSEFKKIDINFARRGDLVASQLHTGLAIGVNAGEFALFKASGKGTVAIPFHRIVAAWRVK